MSEWYVIGPGEALDYEYDWSKWLGAQDDISGDPTWSIVPIGPTVTPSAPANKKTQAIVSGCVFGKTYRLRCRIVSQAGRTAEREFTLKCGDR